MLCVQVLQEKTGFVFSEVLVGFFVVDVTLSPAPALLLLRAWWHLREQLELCQGMFRLGFRKSFFP